MRVGIFSIMCRDFSISRGPQKKSLTLKPDLTLGTGPLKSHALSVRLTQTNSILRSHAETIISHVFEIPCSFSKVPL